MRAMVLDRPRTPLVMRERPTPVPAAGEILIEISACGVCRTDLHVVDGELPDPKLPDHSRARDRRTGRGAAGRAFPGSPPVPVSACRGSGATCGVCPYCRDGRENLCDRPLFTGYTRDGGFADPYRGGCSLLLRAAAGAATPPNWRR